jgi:anti-sigma factor RsiW
MPNRPISDDDIHRFLDGELTPEQRSDLQARLALDPDRAAQVFAEAKTMEALRSIQPHRLFPPRASMEGANRLRKALRRRSLMAAARLPVAAVLLIAAGWMARSLTEPFILPDSTTTASDNFILGAREALRVAQLDAGPKGGIELGQDKIERVVGAINISMPPLPTTWQVKDVQVQPWNGKQSLVVTAISPVLGQITLVAAPMDGEGAVPLTAAADGRIPTVYWQSGGTAYALMGPAASERLEKEAKNIEVVTRRNVNQKVRG